MKHSSEKPLAPANYSRCFNNQCPKADNCLHRLAALRDTPEYPSIRIINPLCIPEDSSQCAYFQSTQKIHVAWGISHLLDEVPYKNLQPLKSTVAAAFIPGVSERISTSEKPVDSPFRPRKILPLLPGRILPFPRRPELYPQNFPPIQHSGGTGFQLLQRGIQMVER